MGTTKKEVENRRILEEIQQQKRQLMIKNSHLNPLSSGLITTPRIRGKEAFTEPLYPTLAQKQALQNAQSASFASFMVQDSSYGNVLLPIVPRVDASKATPQNSQP